jgi:hypothetical protein
MPLLCFKIRRGLTAQTARPLSVASKPAPAPLQGQPKQALSVPQQSALAAGLTDLAFFGGGGPGGGSGAYVVLASGSGGQVFLWDTRARAAPCAVLQAPQAGAINTVQLWPDGQVVAGGGASGDVRLWDLRGGASSALRFGGTVHHHPLLAAVSLRLALTAVPGLASQTAIPASGVQSLALDPRDPRRLAFHLGCGWSGVLRLQGGGASAVTHLHAPAHPHPDEPLAAAGGGSTQGSGAAAAAASVAQMLLWASTAAPGEPCTPPPPEHCCWVCASAVSPLCEWGGHRQLNAAPPPLPPPSAPSPQACTAAPAG